MIFETILALWPVEEIECLALNIYHEARGESFDGQLAVAHVTINRLKDHHTLCEAVYAPNQFTWQPTPILEPHAFAAAVSVALIALQTPDITNGATHYYAHDVVTPYWASILEPVAVIENHTFMKE